MAAARKRAKPTVRDEPGHGLRPGLWNQWIQLSSNHERWRVDVRQLFLNTIFQRHPDGCNDPPDSGVPIILRHEQTQAWRFAPGIADESYNLSSQCSGLRINRRSLEYQSIHTLRMPDCKMRQDLAA